MTIREKYGYFENMEGIDVGLPIRYEKTPRWLIGYIPCWPFTRYPIQTDKAIYRVRLKEPDPFQFVAGTEFEDIGIWAGTLIQIGKDIETDQGSVPVPLQPYIAKDSFQCSFINHDSGYILGGMWIKPVGFHKFYFHAMTRADVDKMLFIMVLAEGGSSLCANMIYHAVNLGGWAVWSPRKF